MYASARPFDGGNRSDRGRPFPPDSQGIETFDTLLRERPSIGDAVISTDVAGNITYLNPVAESMTGWSRQEASGRPLPEVLRLVDGDDSRSTQKKDN
jgi:PAS domain-containing protein